MNQPLDYKIILHVETSLKQVTGFYLVIVLIDNV